MNTAVLMDLRVMCRKLLDIDDDMTVTQLMVLIEIGLNEGKITTTEISENIGIPNTSVSRTVGKLSRYGYSKERKGLDLIDLVEDLDNRRRRLLFFTPKGKMAMEKIVSAFKEGRKRGDS